MASSGMAWMNNETKDVVSVPAADIKWASWFRVARNFRLRVGLKDKSRRENFDGFMRDVSCLVLTLYTYLIGIQDHDKLASLLKQHYGIILENKEISFKGWNWGTTDFQGVSCLPLPLSTYDSHSILRITSLIGRLGAGVLGIQQNRLRASPP